MELTFKKNFVIEEEHDKVAVSGRLICDCGCEMIDDKIRRLDRCGLDYSKVNFIRCDFNDNNWINEIYTSVYENDKISFWSLLGISYYLTKREFYNMIKSISSITCKGSSIVFDYPNYEKSKETLINEKLASGANEI